MANDPFLAFVDLARHAIAAPTNLHPPPTKVTNHSHGGPTWAWIVSRLLACCRAYPSGVTSAILLSELFQAWHERELIESRWRHDAVDIKKLRAISLKRGNMPKPFNASHLVTIDSIYETRFVALDAVLDVIVVDVKLIPGTKSYLVTLGDAWSLNIIDLYLHRKFYDMLDCEGGILKKGRELRLTGCCLRTTLSTGMGRARLLPTEYLVIVLNEEQDDDALLLGAQFCSDTFSSIDVAGFHTDNNYCFYSRLEKIGTIEILGNNHQSRRQTIALTDSNGDSLPFVFWDESIALTNILSVGSMIAIERPIVSRDNDQDLQTSSIVLEYGKRTRLYIVPLVHQQEQVIVLSTQSSCNACENLEFANSTVQNEDHPPLSQVMLHRDVEGYIDFKKYPIQLLIEGLKPKMANVSLYGLVTSINMLRAIDGRHIASCFTLDIKDNMEAISIELHFENSWSIGEIFSGHTIFISGLRTSYDESERLRCMWYEREAGALVVNISLLPGLLSSPCLHKVMPLAYLSENGNPCVGHVFKVCIGRLCLEELSIRPVHPVCGHFVFQNSDHHWTCSFCHSNCEGIAQRCSMIITLHDANQNTAPGVRVACFGQPATDILQTSPEEFYSWPQDEQAMYLCSLEDEVFLVNLTKQSQEFLSMDELVTDFDKKARLLHYRICCALRST